MTAPIGRPHCLMQPYKCVAAVATYWHLELYIKVLQAPSFSIWILKELFWSLYGTACFNNLRNKVTHLFKLCHCRPILGIDSLARGLPDTWKWVFWAYAHREGVDKKKSEKNRMHFIFLIVSLQANIRNTFFDHKSPRHPEVGVQ